ncbi:MAG: DUF2892 domain-containing protein [Candidatus Goldiibacteriota bacterium HGW-Goldbacteria-1]|jgi:hypothetical protein|nr:MAG: DUF2892 domain-containing protein [Candidatus Goldiibacteriota bacterium HGW-Goldbacteria-1]
MFKPNEGKTDRIVRVVLGVGLVAAGFLMTGPAAIVLWVLGAISLITGAIGFCGLYALLGINTCPINKK